MTHFPPSARKKKEEKKEKKESVEITAFSGSEELFVHST